MKSALDDITGVGPKTKVRLLDAFGDIKGIKAASKAELQGVVSLKVAQAIRVHFHGERA